MYIINILTHWCAEESASDTRVGSNDFGDLFNIRTGLLALQASLANSDDHKLLVMTFSSSIQCVYTSFNSFTALLPAGVSRPPIRIRSGRSKFAMAVPYNDNSILYPL